MRSSIRMDQVRQDLIQAHLTLGGARLKVCSFRSVTPSVADKLVSVRKRTKLRALQSFTAHFSGVGPNFGDPIKFRRC
jgi:hypothetical protein